MSTILIVDDEPVILDVLRRFLEGEGRTLLLAGSAREALAAIGREAPDVLVSDIAMPGEDGFALIRGLRAAEGMREAPPLPAVALTAFARPEDRRAILEAGFDAHLAKPIEPEELLTTLHAMLRRAGRTAPAEGGRAWPPEPLSDGSRARPLELVRSDDGPEPGPRDVDGRGDAAVH